MSHVKPTDRFYLRRKDQTVTISAEKLLTSYNQKRIREDDLIRQSGTTEWKTPAEFGWKELEASLSAGPISTEDQSAKKSSQPAQVVSASQPKERPKASDPSWWTEESSNDQKRSVRAGKGRLLRFGSGVLLILLGLYFLASMIYQESEQNLASNQSAKADSVQAAGPDTEPPAIVETPKKTEELPVQANLEDSNKTNQTESTSSSAPSSEPPDFSLDSVDKPPETKPKSKDETPPTITQAAPDKTAAPSNTKTESKVTFGVNSKISDSLKVENAEEAFKSKSAEVAAKSDLDIMFDVTAALLDFYLKNNQEQKDDIQKYRNLALAIKELETQLTEANATVSNAAIKIQAASLIVAQADEELRAHGSVGRDNLVAKRREALTEMNLLSARVNEIKQVYPSKKAELLQKMGAMQLTNKSLTTSVAREREYMVRLLEDLDLYSEKPQGYHKRIKVLTSELLSRDPDLLVGHILQASAAIALGDVETSERAVQNLRQQLQLAIELDLEFRRPVISRYMTIGDLLDARRLDLQSSYDAANHFLQIAERREPQFAHSWLAHGLSYSKRGKSKEARSMFERATRLGKDDVRIQRVALKASTLPDFLPKAVFKSMADHLAEKAGPSDWLSWQALGHAYHLLDERDLARAALDRIQVNSLNQASTEELRKKLDGTP